MCISIAIYLLAAPLKYHFQITNNKSLCRVNGVVVARFFFNDIK